MAVALLSLAIGAVGLFVRETPALSLRIPSGWHVSETVPQSQLSLAGPHGATFEIRWSPEAISYGCADVCGGGPVPSRLAYLDGELVTLLPWPGGSKGDLGTGPFAHDADGHTLYFTVHCRPSNPLDGSVCADIVDSIRFSAPLFACFRPDIAAIAIS